MKVFLLFQFKSELSVIQSRHKAEIAEVHRQMSESKTRGREAEGIMRKEIEGLKNIIRDLEARLGIIIQIYSEKVYTFIKYYTW